MPTRAQKQPANRQFALTTHGVYVKVMLPADVSIEERATCQGTVTRRLYWLLAAHMLLCILPATARFLPAQMRFSEPLLFMLLTLALSYPTLGQMMLLGLWTGLGIGRTGWRVASSLLGCAYLAIWPIFTSSLPATWADGLGQYCRAVISFGTGVGVLAGAFFVVRIWFCELRSMPAESGTRPSGRLQYSMLNVMVAMTAVALLLGLAGNATPGGNSGWQSLATGALLLVIFCIDALCAVWATLSPGRIGLRLSIVFLVAMALGLVLSITAGHFKEVWWLMPFWILTWLLPFLVVVASLLVIRACGYRLVPKSPCRQVAQPGDDAHERLAATERTS